MDTLDTRRKLIFLAAIFAGLLCIILFLPAVRWGFVNYDDPEYVLNNPVIKGLALPNVIAMFTQPHAGWWMPLTWLSLAVDYHFWGLDPAGYHLTNIILHGVNTSLVVLAVDAVCRGEKHHPAARFWYPGVLLFAGLFFGAHPLRVESVVWVTERKDVLNGLFVFSSLVSYLHYVSRQRSVPQGGKARSLFWLSVFFFALSLMAKSVSVVLPVMLIILDWVPLGRLRQQSFSSLVLEKWPFLFLSFVMVISTFFFATQSRYLVTYEAFPLLQRSAVSGNAVVEYFRLLLLPIGLSPFYVIPDPIPLSYTAKEVLVALVIVYLAGCGWRQTPRLTAGFLCFLVPLLPVLAFFQNGDQSYADRFTYLPASFLAIFLGHFLLATNMGADFAKRRFFAAAGLVVIAMFGIGTWSQIKVWQSTETFWSRIIQVEPLAISYKERGKFYHAAGRYTEAVADFTAALERIPPTLKPYEYNFYAMRGESLRMAGDLAAAVSDFDTAIALHSHPSYFYHRGLALRALGRAGESEQDFRKAGPDAGPIMWID